jgi:hypothetical protein
LGFGLWALGFGLWALGFGLWALGFGLWALEKLLGRDIFMRSSRDFDDSIILRLDEWLLQLQEFLGSSRLSQTDVPPII